MMQQRDRLTGSPEELLELLRSALTEPHGAVRRAQGEAVRAELLRLHYTRWSQRGGPIVRVR